MLFRFMKTVDKAGKMFIPKVAIEKFGKNYYMEVHEDCIKLVPIKKGE